MIRRKKIICLLSGLSLFGSLFAVSADAFAYNDMYISYYSPANVQAMVKYAMASKLGGSIMWEIAGDTAYNSPNSLLNAAVLAYKPQIDSGNPPMMMTYWADWDVYKSAIPEKPYSIPGSSYHNQTVVNTNFTEKLQGVNVLAYAFLQAIPNNGTLYFEDPWSDLTPDDKFCTQHQQICNHISGGGNMGNFEAFAKLSRSDTQHLGELKKIISVGGAGEDDTFEKTFTNVNSINNFTHSAKEIIDNYHLDGIDLDYEDTNMTYTQSEDFLKLVIALRKELPDKLITVTLLSDPDYLLGTESDNTVGFAPGILLKIAHHVNKINLMTYEFYGASSYDPTDSNSSKTGFMTSLYLSNKMPPHDPKISVVKAVNALTVQGIEPGQITVGIPAYGNALANIPSNNGGLFQPITANAVIPSGDLDQANCDEDITNQNDPNLCTGSFQYKYILKYMLGQGFTSTQWIQKEHNKTISNGTTAYASQWTVKESLASTKSI